MKDGINYEKRTMYVSISLIIAVVIIIALGLKLINTSKELNDTRSNPTNTHTDEEYDAAVACFKATNDKLLQVSDIGGLAGGVDYSNEELVNFISDIHSIADGGTLAALSDGTNCPSI